MSKKPPTPEKLKAIRLRLGESQKEFAARIGLDQATISRYETFGIPTRGAQRFAIEALLAEIDLERV